MVLKFYFKKESSLIFGNIFRPVAWVTFWSRKINNWVGIWMIVDSGADYTLLPRIFAKNLGIDFKKDCFKYKTSGVGGEETVFFLKKQKVRLGIWEREIPIGFLDNDLIPPLLGRKDFLEIFKTTFYQHQTIFEI